MDSINWIETGANQRQIVPLWVRFCSRFLPVICQRVFPCHCCPRLTHWGPVLCKAALWQSSFVKSAIQIKLNWKKNIYISACVLPSDLYKYVHILIWRAEIRIKFQRVFFAITQSQMLNLHLQIKWCVHSVMRVVSFLFFYFETFLPQFLCNPHTNNYRSTNCVWNAKGVTIHQVFAIVPLLRCLDLIFGQNLFGTYLKPSSRCPH